jgi:hypothetical protein
VTWFFYRSGVFRGEGLPTAKPWPGRGRHGEIFF